MKQKAILMIRVFLVLLSLATIQLSCNFQEKEEELKRKEAALNEREQQLILREQTLALKEEQFAKVQEPDSTAITDTTHIVNQSLIGVWDVKMTCTETTCPGSAVGDTKKETWQISYQATALIAKAMVNEQLVRAYTGFFTGNTIELVEDKTTVLAPSVAKIIVRLRLTDETHMEGEREIIRENNCKVIYAMQMQKSEN